MDAAAGQLIVGFLKQIGIKVDLLPATDAKMNDYWGSGNFDAYIWYWSGDPDPNYQLFVFTSDQCGAWSDGCWQDSHFDKLYEAQHTEMNQTKRQKIVKEAQERMNPTTRLTEAQAQKWWDFIGKAMVERGELSPKLKPFPDVFDLSLQPLSG